MATLITAPQVLFTTQYSIFLAGAIDMGKAVNWQAQVIKALENEPEITLVNPRRENFTPDTLDEQIRWELDALERVNTVFMWFPREAAAPISFLETGLYMTSGKLLIGVEPGFYRRRNLELTCEHYKVMLWSSIEELLWQVPKTGY